MTRFEAQPLAECAEWFAHAINYPDGKTTASAPSAMTRFLDAPDEIWRAREGVIYCSLFDIGKPEPLAPLQEGSYHSDPHARLRRVVNFYRHYSVAQQSQWSPDHLSVEMFFLSYLLRLADAFPQREDLRAAIRSFVRLHPGSFVWQCAERVRKHDSSGVYVALYDALVRFLYALGAEQRISLSETESPLEQNQKNEREMPS